MEHKIRFVRQSDTEGILNIYAPYIRDTSISFETDVPTSSEFESRIESISKNYPYLVYQVDDLVVGYAYASMHSERDAYRFDVNVSVYVMPEYHSAGVAYKLYHCLFSILKKLGYINVYAGYTVPNIKSMKFHEKFGFEIVGTYHNTGYKFGKWHDVTWLEKTINEQTDNPKELILLCDLDDPFLNDVLSLNNFNGVANCICGNLVK